MLSDNGMKKGLRSLLFIFYPLWNLLWVYLFMELTRLAFLWENRGLFDLSWKSFALISRGGLLFDTAAIFYVNCLWLALVFFPLHLKERPWWFRLEKWVFIVSNAIAWTANLCDSAFYSFRQHRSTMAIFTEFGGEDNVGKIILTETLRHWYFVLLLAAMVRAMWKLYRSPAKVSVRPLRAYYLSRTLGLGLWIALFIFCVRGCTFSKVTRPIAVGYAQRFATQPMDVDLVLNTPFAMLRTIGGSPSPSPKFFADEAELLSVFNPVHQQPDSASAPLRGKNVMFIVLESFSAEWSGLLNPRLEGGRYRGYLPNLDSLLTRSLRFEHTYSNSGFSIDALPALLASTPRMRRPFVVSPYSLNHVTGIGELLGAEGYRSAFFLGADNESLGIQAFVRQAGFDEYYGINEYLADSSTGGKKDYDGTWGIWDEPYLQYVCAKLGRMPEPFLAGVFTLSSHHPFDIPKHLEDRFPREPEKMEIVRTLRYADYALGQFFKTAERQPWFLNTVFVISADHTFLHKPEHDSFNNEMGRARIPIAIYDPSGAIAPGVRPGSMQQIDVLPTLLGLMGYRKPFFAFGQDVLSIPADSTWSIRWNHVPQIMQGDYVLQIDPETWQATGLYNHRADSCLRRNLLNEHPEIAAPMRRRLEAFIQTYTESQIANKVHL